MANALCGVCAEWRAAILNEEAYRRDSLPPGRESTLPRHGDLARRGRAPPHVGAPTTRRGRRRFARTALKDDAVAGARVPEILVRAAQTGANVTAFETLGALREARGDHAGAYKAWEALRRALGSSIGQFKLGEIFYRGLGNQGVDGEEALFWLSKAVKNQTAPLAPESMATAAGIMGFLHLDGEGTQPCNPTAVKWFKDVRHSLGNREAGDQDPRMAVQHGTVLSTRRCSLNPIENERPRAGESTTSRRTEQVSTDAVLTHAGVTTASGLRVLSRSSRHRRARDLSRRASRHWIYRAPPTAPTARHLPFARSSPRDRSRPRSRPADGSPLALVSRLSLRN